LRRIVFLCAASRLPLPSRRFLSPVALPYRFGGDILVVGGRFLSRVALLFA
jgi:hypothetical protein